MSGTWPQVAISDVAQLIRGVTYSKADARATPESGLAPVLRATNIQDSHLVLESDLVFVPSDNISPTQRLRAGDIVMATSSGSKHLVGKSALMRTDWAGSFGAFCAALRSKSNIEPRYLSAFLQSPAYWKQVTKKALGVNINNLRRGDIETLMLPLPTLDEQREIVAELEKQFSRLDEAVANLQRVKANLKRYTESVYAEVFGNEPNCTLGDLIDEGPQNGLYLPKEMYGEGVPILRIDDYQTAWIRPLAELQRVKATQDQISTWALREDDLVINRVNSMTHLGKCALVPASLAGTVFESNMMRMRLKTEVSPKYVEHYLASRLGKTRLTENAKWAVNQASINQKDVRATPIFLPDLATQQQIVADIDRRLSIIKGTDIEVQANIKRAQALRQSTLSKAFAT